jgi:hypothetical protein
MKDKTWFKAHDCSTNSRACDESATGRGIIQSDCSANSSASEGERVCALECGLADLCDCNLVFVERECVCNCEYLSQNGMRRMLRALCCWRSQARSPRLLAHHLRLVRACAQTTQHHRVSCLPRKQRDTRASSAQHSHHRHAPASATNSPKASAL